MARLLQLLCVCLTLSATPFAAEYHGQDIDGRSFDATAYSYDTSGYYNVTVEFEGDEAIVYMPKGGSIRLTLDDEEVDDPHDIQAYDYQNSVYWDLDVDGLD